MIEWNCLSLGTMSMSVVRNSENSVKTIHTVPDVDKTDSKGMCNLVFMDGIMLLA